MCEGTEDTDRGLIRTNGSVKGKDNDNYCGYRAPRDPAAAIPVLLFCSWEKELYDASSAEGKD